MTEPNLKIRVSPEYNFKRVQNTLECCADYLSELDLGEAAWLLDDVRDALTRMPEIGATLAQPMREKAASGFSQTGEAGAPNLSTDRLAELTDFVEQIAGSCIPDYEEAKAEAQELLSISRDRNAKRQDAAERLGPKDESAISSNPNSATPNESNL